LFLNKSPKSSPDNFSICSVRLSIRSRQDSRQEAFLLTLPSSLLLTHYLLSLSTICYKITCVDWAFLNREIDSIIVLITLPPNQWLGVLEMLT
jgi:hypothetical protein